MPATAQQQRVIEAEDLLRFELVFDPQISPSGRHAVFGVKKVGSQNNYQTQLHVTDLEGGTSRPFTCGEKDHSPRWSPDGQQIAFVGTRSEQQPQIYLIPAQGGEARALTRFPEGSIGKFCWSPQGQYLAVAFRITAAEWTREAVKQRETTGASEPPKEIDQLWYRLDGDGYFQQQRYGLYLVDIDTGEHQLLYSKDRLGEFTFDFSPSGTKLAITTNRDRRALLRPWKDELAILDLPGGKLTSLKGLPAGPKEQVRWSPDGQWLAFAGREGREGSYSVENLELYIHHLQSGHTQSLTGETDLCLLAVPITDTAEAEFAPSLQFSRDSKRVFMNIGREGAMHIASVPVRGGKVTFHTTGPYHYDLGNVANQRDRVILTRQSGTSLADVFVTTTRPARWSPKRVTDLNGPLFSSLLVAQPESHWVTAADGHRTQIWVLKPPRSRNRKFPAILEIHGGPHAQYGVDFFHEFQLLAAAGYIVVYGNPRGSKGYGRDHCAAIKGDWGSADWLDIQSILKFMKQQPDIDHRYLGVMGGSYGGYMTNWVCGHCDDFTAAISDRCVSNLVSMSGNSDFPLAEDVYFPGNGWDRTEARWAQSPMAHLGQAKTPTLIIHSEGDLRCNIEQSEQVFTALQLRGIPSRFVRYPRSTSHGMSRNGPPDLRLHRLGEILSWWKKYLHA